jgi:hypothetical protein
VKSVDNSECILAVRFDGLNSVDVDEQGVDAVDVLSRV